MSLCEQAFVVSDEIVHHLLDLFVHGFSGAVFAGVLIVGEEIFRRWGEGARVAHVQSFSWRQIPLRVILVLGWIWCDDTLWHDGLKLSFQLILLWVL